MQILRLDRQEGKTTSLIRWVLHDPDHRVVLLPDERQAHAFTRKLYGAYDRLTPTPSMSPRDDPRWWDRCVATPFTIRRIVAGRDFKTEVSIDNLEEVLFNLIGHPVDVVTTSDAVIKSYDAEAVH